MAEYLGSAAAHASFIFHMYKDIIIWEAADLCRKKCNFALLIRKDTI